MSIDLDVIYRIIGIKEVENQTLKAENMSLREENKKLIDQLKTEKSEG